jgi:hypothetical protein
MGAAITLRVDGATSSYMSGEPMGTLCGTSVLPLRSPVVAQTADKQ